MIYHGHTVLIPVVHPQLDCLLDPILPDQDLYYIELADSRKLGASKQDFDYGVTMPVGIVSLWTRVFWHASPLDGRDSLFLLLCLCYWKTILKKTVLESSLIFVLF